MTTMYTLFKAECLPKPNSNRMSVFSLSSHRFEHNIFMVKFCKRKSRLTEISFIGAVPTVLFQNTDIYVFCAHRHIHLSSSSSTAYMMVTILSSMLSIFPSRFFSFAAIDFTYHTLARDCVAVDEQEASTKDGCRDSSSGAAKELLGSALQGLSVGDVTYKGEACYYSYFTSGVGHVRSNPTMTSLLLLFLLLVSA